MAKGLRVCILLVLLVACQGNLAKENEVKPLSTQKKVIMIMLDTMMGSLVESGIEKGTMPALHFLIKNGKLYKEVVAPFPTMSVSIESTLITGEMPNKHKIPALSWYESNEDRLINYGTSFPILYKLGLSQGIYDALYHLNNTHLSKEVKTIYEELEEGHISSGAVNTLVYRGDYAHDLQLPVLTDEFLDVPQTIETKGPEVLIFGNFTKNEYNQSLGRPDGVWNQYGINDEFTSKAIRKLIREGTQPDFLMAFFPNFDKDAHKNSPHYRKGFEKTDQYLQDILNEYDSWEEALEQNIFILVGDHGADKLITEEAEMAIDLNQLYNGYRIPKLSEGPRTGDLVFGVNGRMSYVYDVHHAFQAIDLVEKGLMDRRVDVAVWQEQGWIYVKRPENKNVFRFKPQGKWKDRYDQTWTIEGDPEILTLDLEQQNQRISYVDYPDALNQLYSAMDTEDSHSIILTAKPGYSFLAEGVPTYPDGGEHGGFHKNDALTAMIIAGTTKEPTYLRIVDLKEYILGLFRN